MNFHEKWRHRLGKICVNCFKFFFISIFWPQRLAKAAVHVVCCKQKQKNKKKKRTVLMSLALGQKRPKTNLGADSDWQMYLKFLTHLVPYWDTISFTNSSFRMYLLNQNDIDIIDTLKEAETKHFDKTDLNSNLILLLRTRPRKLTKSSFLVLSALPVSGFI